MPSILCGTAQYAYKIRSTITIDDIKEVADVCKKHGVQSYLTLNTVMYDYDMQLVQKIVNTCKEDGIDAIIASDYAVFEIYKTVGIPLHINTNCQCDQC